MIRQFSLALAMATTALIAVPLMASDGSPDRPQIVGGYSPMDVASDSTLAIAKIALPLVGEDPANLVQVLSAEQQVVAGLNYKMQIQVASGDVWAVTVYRNLQGEYTLTAYEKLAPPAEANLKLNNNGFVVTGADGSVMPIPFGTPKAETMAAISFRPDGGESTNDECGAGAMAFVSWPDGLNLLFQDDNFVGWSLDERGDGVPFVGALGIGTTLGALKEAGDIYVEETTLGQEFVIMGETGELGGINGLLEANAPDAKVTAMWAGTSCNFR